MSDDTTPDTPATDPTGTTNPAGTTNQDATNQDGVTESGKSATDPTGATNQDGANQDTANQDGATGSGTAATDSAGTTGRGQPAANPDGATDSGSAIDSGEAAADSGTPGTDRDAARATEAGGADGTRVPASRGRGPRRSTRGQLALAVVACTLGAGVALYAASKNWSVDAAQQLGPLRPQRAGQTGTEITPVVPTLSLISLAGAGALVATRRVGRVLIGVLLVLAGLGVTAGAGWGLAQAGNGTASARPGWGIVALAGGVLVAVVGGVALRRGRRWPTMGSRYERPTGAGRPVGVDDDAAKIWDAIDEGQDPTIR